MRVNNSLRSRIEKLEQARAPAVRVFIFTGDDDDRSHDEQLAAFKAEHGVTPRDHLVVVTFDDAA